MPTIALLNGHGFAGGFMTAMHHDYRLMNPGRGFVCLNELDFGANLKPPMSSIFREKLSPQAYRAVVLEAHRFSGQEALDSNIIDGLGGLPEVLAFIERHALTSKGKSGIYGRMKREMYRQSVALLSKEGWDTEEQKDKVITQEEDERRERGKKAVDEWKKKNGIGAKL
jgi:Delta3-Delta2-enoyl-CoA isomerase